MTHFLKVAAIIAAFVALSVSLAEAAPKRPGVTPELIGGAIAILQFNRDDAQWTKAGKPRVDAIEGVLQADISAADRDAAWKAYKTPAVAYNSGQESAINAQRLTQLEADLAAATHARAEAMTVIARLTRDRDEWQSRAAAAEDQIDLAVAAAGQTKQHYENALADLEADRHVAATARQAAEADAAATRREADAVLAEALARERGAGPPANRDCRRVLAKVLGADWTWAGNLKAERNDVAAAHAACFN